MYRILLADDEGIMLESLKTIIENNFGDECELSFAKTGRAVIEQADVFRPDIAFMDIQMPGLNGIQAMQEIRKTNKSVIFIVITAYDKFNYAKEAINLGVLDYLTKPVNKQVVLDVLRTAMHQVDESRQKRSDDLKIREKLEAVVPAIESGFIYELLLSDGNAASVENYKNLLDVQEEYGCIVILEFGDMGENGKITNEVGARVKAEKYYTQMREVIGDYISCIIGPIMANRIILLVPSKDSETDYRDRVKFLERIRSMVYKLEEEVPCYFRGSIGLIREFGDMKQSYQDALNGLRKTNSHVIHIKDVPGTEFYDGEYPAETERKYFQKLLKADYQGAVHEANTFFQWMVDNYSDHQDEIRLKVLEFVMKGEQDASLNSGVPYGFGYRKDYLATVEQMSDYGELGRWFVSKTLEICRNTSTTMENQTESLVHKAKHYIEENYQKDISLDDVAQLVDISPYYFSKLFKQEAGKNFIEYLTEVRMQHARQFLEDSKYSIKEVCIMSGYSDPNYFSRIFKKFEGMTPSEYRERL